MFDVDFENKNPQLLCHQDYKKFEQTILKNLEPYDLQDHFILFSSGTTGGDLKGYAVSKKALFANAKAVNEHFSLSKDDVWGLSLPIYHIGGLSVVARAYLLGNKIVDLRHWEPESWYEKVQDVTITTIVPTQMYDIVKRKLRSPKNLKYIVVGGDLLSSELKSQALELGWPVIRTFGMSEVCSQLASAKRPKSDDVEILPIHQAKTENDRLMVKSEALFTLEFTMGETFKVTLAKDLCTQDGYYLTKDRAELYGKSIRHLGRLGDDIKIAGHLVNLALLKETLASWTVKNQLYNQVEIAIEIDDRKGKKLVLMSIAELNQLQLDDIGKTIAPVKIDEFRRLDSFERTALGKLKIQKS